MLLFKVSTTDSIPGTGGASVGTDTSKMSNSSIMALFSSVPQNKGMIFILFYWWNVII